MRQLRRPRLTPPTLRAGEGAAPDGDGHRTAQRHRAARAENPGARPQFPKHWNQPDVRGALTAMHGRVCAYCQCSLARTRGDVEHYRPSSIYWWLAYSFSNYLLSCCTCNRERKIGRFPLLPGARRVGFSQREELNREARLLLDPTEDPVEDWMRTDFEDELCRIENRCDAETEAWARVDETCRIFRLNLDPGLLQERQRVVDTALELLELQVDDPASRERLRRMASRFAPHGTTVRNVLQALDHELLPSAEEERRWLFDEFVERLDKIQDLLLPTDDPFLLREQEEALWALAVLWKDPPTEEPAEIAGWLEAAGIYDEIRPYYERL